MDYFRKVVLCALAGLVLVVVVSSALAAPPGERRAALAEVSSETR